MARSDPGNPGLSIEVDQHAEGLTVCHPIGDLDAFTVSRFRQMLSGLTSCRRLLIDLSDVPFIDSSGLGALIGAIRGVRELGGEVAVVSTVPATTRLLRTAGFDRIVTVAATVDEAAGALGCEGEEATGSTAGAALADSG